MDEQKLTTIELVSKIIANSHNLNETLNSIVLLVKSRVKCDVCSIYLLNKYEEILELKATIGLNPETVDKVKIHLDEGLVGEVINSKKLLVVPIAKEHPAFKYIPETNEDKVISFLGVPLFDRGSVIGVLTIQTKDLHEFTKSEIKLINAIASQISLVIVNAKLLQFINAQKEALSKEKEELEKMDFNKKTKERVNLRLSGVPASRGIAVGTAHFFRVRANYENLPNEKSNKEASEEWETYIEAVEKSKLQLIQLEIDITKVLSEEEGKIFHTHLMILEDTGFHEKINHELEKGWKASTAIKKVINDYVNAFNKIEDKYLKERVNDIKDIGNRLISNILNRVTTDIKVPKGIILIAKDLTASEIATLDVKNVKGIILQSGGAISHTSILAKSFGIPVVAGIDNVLSTAREGDKIALDGTSGSVFINPDEKTKKEYKRLEIEYDKITDIFKTKKDVSPNTKDGYKVCIGANVGLFSELEFAIKYGAEEIGLYRTEFPFAIRDNFPDEEQQFSLYQRVLKKFDKGPVTFRCLDIGGDKFLPYYKIKNQSNPFLGFKSIRILFKEMNIFKAQIRAILRASVIGPTRIMFPMVSSIDEMIQIKEIFETCKNELEKEGHKYNKDIQLGIMIEVPSAIKIASSLAKYVDFFSIGTNDLIQYLLAVDRNNRDVSPMYRPLHPSVLMSIKEIIDRGHDEGIWVSMCGEMAGNYLFTPILLGFGLDKFHMSPSNIPLVKLTALELNLSDAKEIAKKTLSLNRADDIKKFITQNHPMNIKEFEFHEVD